jgi:hypothetical protein
MSRYHFDFNGGERVKTCFVLEYVLKNPVPGLMLLPRERASLKSAHEKLLYTKSGRDRLLEAAKAIDVAWSSGKLTAEDGPTKTLMSNLRRASLKDTELD